MTTPPVVGVIGIGAMGLAIAKNLLSQGHLPLVRDVRREAEDEARELGMEIASSPAALADRVDLVLVVVVNAAEVEAVLFGADGVAAGRTRRATVMVCSTIAPEAVIGCAERLRALGIDLIDAPISGGPARACAGTMSMMLAGDARRIAEFDAILTCMANRRFIISERVGDGARIKLVNNLLAGINLVAAAEAFALGERMGLDPRRIYEVICESSGDSWVFQDRMGRVLEDDFGPRARVPILTKDVGLATRMADGVGAATPLGRAALARLEQTVAEGYAGLDDAAVIKTYRP